MFAFVPFYLLDLAFLEDKDHVLLFLRVQFLSEFWAHSISCSMLIVELMFQSHLDKWYIGAFLTSLNVTKLKEFLNKGDVMR